MRKKKWRRNVKPHSVYPKQSTSRAVLLSIPGKQVMHPSSLCSMVGTDWAEFMRTTSRMERLGVLSIARDRYSGKMIQVWLTEKGLWYATEMRRLGFKSNGTL